VDTDPSPDTTPQEKVRVLDGSPTSGDRVALGTPATPPVRPHSNEPSTSRASRRALHVATGVTCDHDTGCDPTSTLTRGPAGALAQEAKRLAATSQDRSAAGPTRGARRPSHRPRQTRRSTVEHSSSSSAHPPAQGCSTTDRGSVPETTTPKPEPHNSRRPTRPATREKFAS